MLEKEGLAITIPRRGAQVAQMTEKDLEDVLEVRDALDNLAVASACQKITEEQLDGLDRALKTFQDAITKGDVREIVEADEAFHNVIYAATNNPKLEAIIVNLREQMYRYRYEYVKDNADYSQLIHEHELIIEGLRKRDQEAVKTVMHTHLTNQMVAVKDVIREQNQNAERG